MSAKVYSQSGDGYTKISVPYVANRAPTTSDTLAESGGPWPMGQMWVDNSQSPADLYFYQGGGTWDQNNLTLSTDDTFAAASNSTASSSLAIKTYVDGVAIAGAPDATEVTKGIAKLATTAIAQAGTNDTDIMTAAKVVDLLETPPAIGGTTPAAGTFGALTADGTGAVTLDGNAASQFTTSAGDITIDSNAGSVIIDGGEAVADAILLDASNAAGGIDVDAGTGGITIDSGDAISIDAAAASNFSCSAGDMTIDSAAGSLILTSGENVADSIVISADAGGIDILAPAGAAGQDIDIVNTGGSVNLSATEAVANAISIQASAGGLDVDGAGQVNIASSQNAADAIVINASAGGIDITAAGAATEDIDITNTAGSVIITAGEDDAGAIYIHADAGTSERVRLHSDQGTGVDSVFLESDVGGITLSSGLASGDAINLSASAGGLDLDGALQVNIASSQADAAAIRIDASNAAGGIDVDDGGGGMAFDSLGAISLDAAAASNFSVSGAGVDLDLASAAGRIIVTAGEDAADAIYLHADAGTSEKIRLHSDQGTGLDSVELESDVGGVTVTAGVANAAAFDVNLASGGMTVDAGLGISLDAAAASNFSTSGAGVDLDLASAAGRVIVTAGEDAADCIYLHADAGTSEKIRIHSDQGTGVDSVELASDVGGITLSSGLASADAINLAASAGGVDVDGALQVNIASSQAATGALTLAVSNASANITLTGAVACTPDSITSDNAGVAASINTGVTLITTDGDSNLDNVTLADGLLAGQVKHFAVVAAGNAADSVKITPANMAGGTQITFSADPTGLGCSMVFDGTNWTVFANNGGVIA